MAMLVEQFGKLAVQVGERLLQTPNNPISAAMTLKGFTVGKGAAYLGSMLFSRNVSGPR